MNDPIQIKSDLAAALPMPKIMAGILDVAPSLASVALPDGTLLTAPWRHGRVEAWLPPARGHLLIKHHGPGPAVRIVSQDEPSEGIMGAGTICVVPEGVPCSLEIDRPAYVSHVYLCDARLRRCARDHFGSSKLSLTVRAGYEDPVAAGILDMLSLYAPALSSASMRLFAERAVDLLCLHLLNFHAQGGKHASGPRHRGLADWQVRKVTLFIQAHLEETLSLDDLASQVRLSRCHFSTAFRTATGCTPHEWLVLQRLARACELLAEPGRPVTDVALAVGFATPSAFTAAFRRVKGVTPSDYRRSLLDTLAEAPRFAGQDAYRSARLAAQTRPASFC